MEIYEIILGVVLIIVCLIIIVLCLAQDNKSQNNMTSAITGASSDTFYGKNEGRSKEAKLNKTTKLFTIIFFVCVLCATILPVVLSE